MKMLTFARRNFKEILRDPINIFFGLGFPAVLLLLLSAIQSKIPVDLFVIEKLAPGVAVFGFSFITLFCATLISKDRESSFLQRLYTTPLSASDYILGFALPFIPLSVMQTGVCFLISFFLKLKISVNILYALLSVIPISLFYIFLGIFCGSILGVKQVGGICGALLTNLSAWLSGIWFDLELVGGVFKKIAVCLPFYHIVELEKNIVSHSLENTATHILIISLYTLAVGLLAVICFVKQIKRT